MIFNQDNSDLVNAITNGTLLNGMPQYEMALPTAADFNDYTTPGTYYVISDGDAATMSNIPRAASGTLYVINRAAGNYKCQLYLPTSSLEIVFIRNYNNGAWTSWKTWYTSEHDDANIATVLTEWVAPSGGLKRDEYIFGPNGLFYKAIAAINASAALDIGTNIQQDKVSNHLVETGTWTPKIYDLNTYVRDANHEGVYLKIGKFAVYIFTTPDSSVNQYENLSGINTMLQFRNFPYPITVTGGSVFINGIPNNYLNIQGAIFNSLYIRPNVKSSDFTDSTKVACSFVVFGIC